MKSRISTSLTSCIVFLLSTLCYHPWIGAGSDKNILSITRKKVARVYRCACEETRTVYEAVKKHKKLILGIVAYLAFEGFGYSQDWDTPLRRLFTPKKCREYRELMVRYEVLEQQLRDKELEELNRRQEALMKELDKFLNEQ